MPTYLLSCTDEHRFEVRQPFAAALPDCACGQPTRKLPTTFGVMGGAALPPPAARMPQTWKGTYGGNREYLGQLRRTAEERRGLEERHPELQGDRRPILAHEGRYEGAPLRAGDPVPPPSPPEHRHGAGGHSHTTDGHSHGPPPSAPSTTGGHGAAGGSPTPPTG
jgi:hypothetical protein